MSFFPLISMPMFSPGLPEMLVIAGVIVLVFGAAKLPKLGKGIGEGIRNFKKGIKEETDSSKSLEKAEDEESLDS